MELIEDLDDRPTPAAGTPSRENSAGEVTGDGAKEGVKPTEGVTGAQTNAEQAVDM